MGATLEIIRPTVGRKHFAGKSDDQLIDQVRAGNSSAFEAIYDRYSRGILAFCTHMLGSKEEAEDVLQLTFVSAYRALRNGNQSIALRPWLYTVARNCCLSALRARAGAIFIDTPTEGRSLHAEPPDQLQRSEQLFEM